MKNKSFSQFIKEADSLHKNPAVTPEYLASLDKRGDANFQALSQKHGMGDFMPYVFEVQKIQRGKERELEQVATTVFMSHFGSILGEAKLDLKLVTDPNELNKEMNAHKKIDEELVTSVHKRKILNLITQGEALNAKKLFAGELCREELSKVIGEANANRMIDLLVKITDMASARDWKIPEEMAHRILSSGMAFSGTSRVVWNKPDGGVSESTEGNVPTIVARGADLAMLLHESIKGIYSLINQGGLAHLREDEIRKVFGLTDNIRNEVQDLKRAKMVAADLRDFMNQFPELDDIENGREYVWGKMINAEILPDVEFLELMRKIFTAAPLYRTQEANEPKYTEAEITAAKVALPAVKKIVQPLIIEIQQELAAWNADPYEEPYQEPEPDLGELPGVYDRPQAMTIDDVLDKIGASGMNSLNDEERAILKRGY